MLPHEKFEKDDRSRMEFFAYFVVILLMFLTALVTFVISRTFTCS